MMHIKLELLNRKEREEVGARKSSRKMHSVIVKIRKDIAVEKQENFMWQGKETNFRP